MAKDIILSTTQEIPGREVAKILGIVKGNSIRSRGIGGHIIASLESLVGGEITAYLEKLNETRDVAIKRMVENAAAMGADAVIGMKIESSEVMQNAAEILAYGTAVKLK